MDRKRLIYFLQTGLVWKWVILMFSSCWHACMCWWSYLPWHSVAVPRSVCDIDDRLWIGSQSHVKLPLRWYRSRHHFSDSHNVDFVFDVGQGQHGILPPPLHSNMVQLLCCCSCGTQLSFLLVMMMMLTSNSDGLYAISFEPEVIE